MYFASVFPAFSFGNAVIVADSPAFFKCGGTGDEALPGSLMPSHVQIKICIVLKLYIA